MNIFKHRIAGPAIVLLAESLLIINVIVPFLDSPHIILNLLGALIGMVSVVFTVMYCAITISGPPKG